MAVGVRRVDLVLALGKETAEALGSTFQGKGR